MSQIGGSIESVSIKGRTFSVAADAEANRQLGGFTNEVQSNGDGQARIVKTRMPWKLSGLQLGIDDARGDQEFLQNIADTSAFVAVAITLASGAVYQGQGQIVEEIEFSTQNSTATVTLSGPQKLTKQ